MDSETFKRWVRPWIAAFSFLIPPAYPGPWSAGRDSQTGRRARTDVTGTLDRLPGHDNCFCGAGQPRTDAKSPAAMPEAS
jgi:hypothetical protein